ncbi:DUF5789 family protein [Halorubrum sp. DTA98]|uniref:DUF5789 family protein n=1 Tax=Halorubrum sp. DTA98 TaxID=3402163 RepID=UPI003AAC0BEC
MNDEVKFARLEEAFRSESYPSSRSELSERHAGTTVLYADGEGDLGELIASVEQERFEGPNDLYVAIQNVVPIEAVGEPGQSDGDA